MKTTIIEGPLAQTVRREAQRIIAKNAVKAYKDSLPHNHEIYDREVVERRDPASMVGG